MRTVTVDIPDDVASVLRNSRIEGKILHLPLQLEPKHYQRVKKIIELLGGKWLKGPKHHEFPCNVEELIPDVLQAGVVENTKQTYQIFETPPEVAELLINEIPPGILRDGCQVLEPSAGSGRLIRALADRVNELGISVQITAADIRPEVRAELAALPYVLPPIITMDFLKMPALANYDLILMNPPFTGGDAKRHVLHALKMLRPHGVLLAITPPGGGNDGPVKLKADYRKAIDYYSTKTISLAKDAFKASGTGVDTELQVFQIT